MIKQRKDSISQFEKAGRDDLVAVEAAEMVILQAYLPEQMSDAEVEAAVAAAVSSTGAAGPQDMGKVIGVLKAIVFARVERDTATNPSGEIDLLGGVGIQRKIGDRVTVSAEAGGGSYIKAKGTVEVKLPKGFVVDIGAGLNRDHSQSGALGLTLPIGRDYNPRVEYRARIQNGDEFGQVGLSFPLVRQDLSKKLPRDQNVSDVCDMVHAQMRGLRATLFHTSSSEVETIARPLPWTTIHFSERN